MPFYHILANGFQEAQAPFPSPDKNQQTSTVQGFSRRRFADRRTEIMCLGAFHQDGQIVYSEYQLNENMILGNLL